MSILDSIRKIVNVVFFVDFLDVLKPLQYKMLITVYLVCLIILVKILVSYVLPTNNTFLISSIVVWIQMLILINVLFCDTNLNKTIY